MGLPTDNYPVLINGRHKHVITTKMEHAACQGTSFTILKNKLLGADDTWTFVFTTPAGYSTIFAYEVDALSGLTQRVTLNDVVTPATGTLYNARNRNEICPNTGAQIAVAEDPTITIEGELLSTLHVGSYINPVKKNAGAVGNYDHIWAPASIHTFKYTSDADDNNVVLRFNFIIEPLNP